MEYGLQSQILEAAATLLCGLGLGLVYSLLSVLRRRVGRIAGALLDVLFCLLFGWAVFLLGMGPGAGRLRLYMPLLALLGMALWNRIFGDASRLAGEKLLRMIERAGRFLLRPFKKCLKSLKKTEKICKNIFSFCKNRFTIICNHAAKAVRCIRKNAEKSGERHYEAETFQYYYEDRDSRDDRLRGNYLGKCQKPH